ncbi:MAG: hypothetical protein KAR05_05680 [Candidatus Omnitrophica bacterium]|nr:hypothetical protein [Candidatus Omnitrophota bacterium]
MSYWMLSAVIYTIVIFYAGYSTGNIKSKKGKIEDELQMTKKLLQDQGDSSDRIKATVDLRRASLLKEFCSDKREYLAIWLPSSLVIINIIVTIFLKKGK